MRIKELINEDLEEGWKSTVAGAALAGLAGLGGYLYKDKLPHAVQPGSVQPNPVAKQTIDHAIQLLTNPSAKILKAAAEGAGLRGQELAQFLAQCAHETHNFNTLKEYGGSLDFRKYDIKFNPRKAKELGNKSPGDGAKYKGRGFIQLTGKYNYAQAQKALGLPLLKHPELMEKPEVATKAAIWYWQNRVQPNVQNFDDVRTTTYYINKGLQGLDDRKIKYDGLKHVITTPSQNVAAK